MGIGQSVLGFSQMHPVGRENKRQNLGLGGGLKGGSRFRPGPGLSVMVPNPGSLGGFPEELRSPFEPKPVSN